MQTECSITQKVDFVNSSFQITGKISITFFILFSFCLLVCSPSSNTDKASARFEAWAGSWSWRGGKTFIQLTRALLKVRPFTNSISLPCFIKPLFCWLLCQEFPVTLLSSIYCTSLALARYCVKPNIDAKRERASGVGFVPKDLWSPSLENLPTVWQG